MVFMGFEGAMSSYAMNWCCRFESQRSNQATVGKTVQEDHQNSPNNYPRTSESDEV